MKKKSHGGKRKGAGKKQKYGEPTVTIRVPKSKKNYIESLLDKQAKK